jgi:hypothetical protein
MMFHSCIKISQTLLAHAFCSSVKISQILTSLFCENCPLRLSAVASGTPSAMPPLADGGQRRRRSVVWDPVREHARCYRDPVGLAENLCPGCPGCRVGY